MENVKHNLKASHTNLIVICRMVISVNQKRKKIYGSKKYCRPT